MPDEEDLEGDLLLLVDFALDRDDEVERDDLGADARLVDCCDALGCAERLTLFRFTLAGTARDGVVVLDTAFE